MFRAVRAKIRLTDEEEKILVKLVRRRSAPHGLVTRASIILLCAELKNNRAVARALGVCADTVTLWSHRWMERRAQGESIEGCLLDLPRSGRPSEITAEQLCQLVALACDPPADHGRPITHWTQEELTNEALKQGIFNSISVRHVGRLLGRLELKPHRLQYWLNNKTDPQRDEKITSICQAYAQAGSLKKEGDRHCQR